MISLLYVLLFLHVLAMAIWIAAALWLAGDVRRMLALQPPADALEARARPALALDAVAGLATLATGALIIWYQAIGMPRPGIIVGIVLTVARLGVLYGLRRVFRGIVTRLRAGEVVAPDDPAARRMSMLSGIAHLLWVLALAGMVPG